MSNVVVLPVITRLPIPVDRVLDSAKHLKSVMVMGWTPEGEFWFAASESDGGDALWLMEIAKKMLLEASV